MSKKDLTASLRTIAGTIGTIRTEYQDATRSFASETASFFLRLCLAVCEGAAVEESLGRDWREWAVKQASGFGKLADDDTFGDPSPATVYRYRNAGHVVSIVGIDAIPVGTTYLALVPFYRLIANATTDEGREKAAATIRSEWAKLARKGRVTEEQAKQAVEALQAPTTRGKQGTDAAGRKAAKDQKNARTRNRNAPTETTETEKNTVEVDPAAVEAASKVIGAFVRKEAKDHNVSPEAVKSIMLGTLRLAKEHGVSTVVGGLAS